MFAFEYSFGNELIEKYWFTLTNVHYFYLAQVDRIDAIEFILEMHISIIPFAESILKYQTFNVTK